jgi:hypothetical protein
MPLATRTLPLLLMLWSFDADILLSQTISATAAAGRCCYPVRTRARIGPGSWPSPSNAVASADASKGCTLESPGRTSSH